MPENCADLAVLRIVVKEGFSRDMANLLLEDIDRILKHFESQPERKMYQAKGSGKLRC